MLEKPSGQINPADERKSRLLAWTPWLACLIVSVPFPTLFLILFMAAGSTETAAIYLLLSFVSMGVGLVVGLLVLIMLFLYRRRWLNRLRDRLASDGITAKEVPWFISELTSEERKAWREIGQNNPLLADAYCETLAARLTATRIIARARRETLRVERQINRTRNIKGVDTTKLLNDLLSDRERSEELRREAAVRLSEARARLQSIEAAANRKLSQTESDLMLRRLAASQEHFPLALEMANEEEVVLRDIDSHTVVPKHEGS
ncbi:MAG TPA: hypothetical protein VK208_03465 [Pyrinomonadaceae bacterium]|jgi:hypothetical protein|nr:hypothetical protein [Pyrinomonadaceae bacterium]